MIARFDGCVPLNCAPRALRFVTLLGTLGQSRRVLSFFSSLDLLDGLIRYLTYLDTYFTPETSNGGKQIKNKIKANKFLAAFITKPKTRT